uniref:BEN domain-containing protein n=1 Tax=Knipowitschia caucasica TaxID=637954 RepID=A0AAV2MQU8_KNICA
MPAERSLSRRKTKSRPPVECGARGVHLPLPLRPMGDGTPPSVIPYLRIFPLPNGKLYDKLELLFHNLDTKHSGFSQSSNDKAELWMTRLPIRTICPEQHIQSKSTDSAFVDGHNRNNPTIHLSPCRQNCTGNKEKSSDSQAPQIVNTVSLATAESRNVLIQQREELLKKLSDIDALLKTLPSEGIQTQEASPAADRSPIPSDDASQEAHDDSSDFSECTDVQSGDDDSPGYLPITEDVISDSTDNSSSEEPSKKKSRPNTRSKQNSKRLSVTKSKQKGTVKRRETKRVKEKSVPSIQDVKCLNSFVANAHTVAENMFREHVSADTYASLAKVLLSRVILFNRRKPGEVSSLKLNDFLSRKMYDTYNYSGVTLSDLERTMCRFFTRIEIRGNCGRIVPVLLKQSFVFGLELLVKNREACGVPAKNPFLFARPTALTSYSGSTILQNYVKDCGAVSPKTLTTAKIRMHYAAKLQMLNLDENEANQILGPNYLDLQSTQGSQVIDPQAFEDIGSQTPVQWDQNSFTYNRPTAYYPDQSHHAQTPALAPAPKRPVTDKPQRVSQKNSKQKWDEAEIQAVERHMMRFIHGHKVPQKADCLQCLDAEAEALRARSWKGVKDFVRNRITALKREESRSASKNLPSTNWTSQDSGYYQF